VAFVLATHKDLPLQNLQQKIYDIRQLVINLDKQQQGG
jgi:hypothetical protein